MRFHWEKHPEQDQALKQFCRDAPPSVSWSEIAQRVGVSPDACRSRAKRQRYPGWERRPTWPGHPVPTVTADAPPRKPVAEVWAQVEEVTTADVARHEAERLVRVEVADDRPIGVSFISDQHIRLSGPIMVRRMREDAELVAGTDGLYAVLAGDGVDNHIKHREAMANGGDKPGQSWRLYNHYLGLFGPDKLLAMISGNHDDWTRDMTGVDRVRDLAEQQRVFYAPDEALIRLTLGAETSQTYRLLVRHQFHMNSGLHLSHAVKRLWEMGEDDFDVGVIGHHHQAACEPFLKHGLRRWAIRPGSYQVTSSYTRRKGYPMAHPTCPTVLLWPGRREIMGFWDVWQAAGYLRWLRDQWPASDHRAA